MFVCISRSPTGTSGCGNGQEVLGNGTFRSPMDVEVDCEEAVTTAQQDDAYVWTAGTIALSVAIFFAAGLAEIGGGWLVWQTVREGRPWWCALAVMVKPYDVRVRCHKCSPGWINSHEWIIAETCSCESLLLSCRDTPARSCD